MKLLSARAAVCLVGLITSSTYTALAGDYPAPLRSATAQHTLSCVRALYSSAGRMRASPLGPADGNSGSVSKLHCSHAQSSSLTISVPDDQRLNYNSNSERKPPVTGVVRAREGRPSQCIENGSPTVLSEAQNREGCASFCQHTVPLELRCVASQLLCALPQNGRAVQTQKPGCARACG